MKRLRMTRHSQPRTYAVTSAAAMLWTACLLAGPASAADTQPGTAASPATSGKAAKASPSSKDKLICTEEQTVGSRISKRICKTAEQASEDEYHAQQMRDRMRAENPRLSKTGDGN